MRNIRLLYTATVRPVLLYGAQEWGTRVAQGTLLKSTLVPLEKAQLACLRRVMRGYKRTLIAALEKEAGIPLIDLYVKAIANGNVSRTRDHSVKNSIRLAAEAV